MTFLLIRHVRTQEAAEAAAALESEIARLAAQGEGEAAAAGGDGGGELGDETSGPLPSRYQGRGDLPYAAAADRPSDDGELGGEEGGGGGGSGRQDGVGAEAPAGLGREEKLRKEANRLVVEELVRRAADAEGQVRRTSLPIGQRAFR